MELIQILTSISASQQIVVKDRNLEPVAGGFERDIVDALGYENTKRLKVSYLKVEGDVLTVILVGCQS